MINNIEETDVPCSVCSKTATMRSFVLQDSRPHKLITSVMCSECGHTDTTQSDFDSLDYAVKITCDFSHAKSQGDKPENENLNRMVFTNSGSVVTVIEDGKVLFEFTSSEPNIESIEGLLMRGKDILKYGNEDIEDDGALDKTKSLLNSILNGGGFGLIIKDNSGFSKICPLGYEYTAIQDKALEELSDEHVKYEKIEKE
ncbi:hypothetical protein PAEPH01_0497 [Pancytospora epiphaga]|nr:hypothetical protein PAEPH01_0497 [Pancytospora epiphaga]